MVREMARLHVNFDLFNNAPQLQLSQPVQFFVGIPGDRDRSFRRIVTDDSDLS
jgi:hypothetical protein